MPFYLSLFLPRHTIGHNTSHWIWDCLQQHFSLQSIANVTCIHFQLMSIRSDLVFVVLRDLGSDYAIIVTAILNFPPLLLFRIFRLISFHLRHKSVYPGQLHKLPFLVWTEAWSTRTQFVPTLVINDTFTWEGSKLRPSNLIGYFMGCSNFEFLISWTIFWPLVYQKWCSRSFTLIMFFPRVLFYFTYSTY